MKETEIEVSLHNTDGGLTLMGAGLSLRGDFSSLLPRIKENNLRGELLIKAARMKGKEHPTLIDATAGMGEDSFLLAASGFYVNLYEQDPIISALLEDSLIRAKEDDRISSIVQNMKLFKEDSIVAMRSLTTPVDVIYLDPMFPGRKKSGLIGKKFQLLQKLERPCDNEAELFEAALQARPKKIVVKRPLKGPYLAEKKPSHSHEGKAIRFDTYLL